MLGHGSITINRGLVSRAVHKGVVSGLVHKGLVSGVVHNTWGTHLSTGLEAHTCPQGYKCILAVHRGLKALIFPQDLRRALVHKGLVSHVVHKGPGVC